MNPTSTPKRKLAALMFTDIVGYTALSHGDERLALELLDEHCRLVRSLLPAFGGREIKTIGDAFLIEFASVVEAAQCAVRIQQAFRERNHAQPESREIQLRISVHLGDIVDSGDDVFGDGVNIAARMLHLSPPGGITVSQSVHDQIQNKVHHPLRSLGAPRLKGISQRISVYELCHATDLDAYTHDGHVLLRRLSSRFTLPFAMGAGAVALAVASLPMWVRELPAALHTAAATQADLRRIAILPFANISDSSEDEYLSDGMTEELISGLSRNPALRVLAASSVNRLKATAQTPAEIARELGTPLLIQGSVRRSGQQLRVSVRLVDAREQSTLWSQDFDGTVKDAFALQRRIADRISSQFRGRAIASIEAPSAGTADSAPNHEAYLLYLKGRYFTGKRTEFGLHQGIGEFQKSIELDPRFAPPYAASAAAFGLLGFYGHVSPSAATHLQAPFLEKALQLDASSAEALITLADKRFFYDHDPKSSEENFRKAIALHPGFATAHQWYAEFLAANGRFEESRAEMSAALDLDPLSLVTQTAAGVPDFYARDYEKALKHFLSTLEMDPGFVLPHYWLGRTYLQQGKMAEAIASLRKAVELSQGSPMMKSTLAYALALAGQTEEARRILDELTTLAETHYVSSYGIATIHAALGDRRGAIEYLNRAAAERAHYLVLIKVDPSWDSLRSDPEFGKLVARLGI